MAKHFVIIDGLSFLFRAYHAVRQGLSRSDGTPTNALFGFAQMLVKVVDDLQPDACAVALDSVGPTFRKDLYDLYKANRPPPEPAMLAQLQMFQPLVEAFGIPAIRKEGVEADDIIATVVAHERAAHGADAHVTIVSSDKDLMQLVGGRVRMLDTLKNRWIGVDEVHEKFGVGPDKVIEVQALIGDSSDNVPGVPSVGPKTAAELIAEFGDLEGIYARLAEVKRDKLRDKLAEFKTQAFLSRELVTLKPDVEMPVGWNELAFAPRVERAADYLEDELEFKTLAKRLRQRNGGDHLPPAPGENEVEAQAASLRFAPPVAAKTAEGNGWGNYECVQTVARWEAWLAEVRKAGVCAIDTETTSLDPLQARLVGVSLAVGEGKACYVPVSHGGTAEGELALEADTVQQVPLPRVLADLRTLLADNAVTKIGHNLKYDWLVLARAYGLIPADDMAAVEGLVANYEDTLLASACLDGGRWNHGMDALAERHLGHRMIAYEDVCGRGKSQVTFDKVALDKATAYAAEDADATWRLWEALGSRLREVDYKEHYGPAHIYHVEKHLLPVVVAMEARGVRVDAARLRELSDDFGRRMAALEGGIYALAGHEFNVNSPAQLAVVLFDEMKVGNPRQQKSRSTAVVVLEEMAEDGVKIAETMMAYRQLAKLRSTYTEALLKQVSPVSGRVHTTYQQIGAATGRFSSTEPNLQNIPIRSEEGRKVRAAFVPQEGWVMVAADYSQIELRLLAHMSGSKGLTRAFTEGADIHAYTASLIHGVPLQDVTKEQRRAAKFINFGLVYGMGAASLAKQIGSSKDEAAAWIEAYFARYDGVKEYMERNKQFARDHGYVETLLGRRVWLPDIKSSHGGLRSNAERAAINAPLQGSNADIIKLAMPEVERVAGLPDYRVNGAPAVRLLMQVHDELVLEARSEVLEGLKEQLPKVMGGVVQLAVPLAVEVGVGPNWEEAH
ncbi:MAG: DNA polymerase I [Pseudomonadaceae bacterium]|nr:DNA polymerase I [Pseudomonadaceae bacterium]